MELIEGIITRRSCRAFTSKPIPHDVMQKIMDTAARSPSCSNTQPWDVAVVTGRKKQQLRKILYEKASTGARSNPDILRPKTWPAELDRRMREHGARRLEALGVARDDTKGRERLRLMNFEFYGAPCALFLFIERELTSISVFDAGLFAQSLILAAHSFGVESCLQGAIVDYPDTVREFLDMPSNKLLVIGISMGYPDDSASINSYQSSRAALDEFVRWYK